MPIYHPGLFPCVNKLSKTICDVIQVNSIVLYNPPAKAQDIASVRKPIMLSLRPKHTEFCMRIVNVLAHAFGGGGMSSVFSLLPPPLFFSAFRGVSPRTFLVLLFSFFFCFPTKMTTPPPSPPQAWILSSPLSFLHASLRFGLLAFIFTIIFFSLSTLLQCPPHLHGPPTHPSTTSMHLSPAAPSVGVVVVGFPYYISDV